MSNKPSTTECNIAQLNNFGNMKEIVTWQASVKVAGQWRTTPESTDLHVVMDLVEKMCKTLNQRYFIPTIVRNVRYVAEQTVEAK